MSMTAYCGLELAPLPTSGVMIYPKGRDPFGNDVFLQDARNEGAQITIPLTDLWVIEPELLRQGLACPWVPIDHKFAPPAVVHAAAHCLQPIAMSQFGQRALLEQGIPALYVPHGVDMEKIKRLDQQEAKRVLGFPQDCYLVGMVFHNKGTPSRKNPEGQIRAFGEFYQRHKDAVLYLHTEVAGVEGEAIWPMIEQAKIPRDAVRIADPYRLLRGTYKHDYMSAIYSAMDVLLHATCGEGFGIPQIEAMACGTPVISTDFTAMPEIVANGAGWLVPVAHEEWTWQESYRAIPSTDGIIEALEKAYAARGDVALREKAYQGMKGHYDADLVLQQHWLPALRQIAAMIEPSTPKTIATRKLSVITPWIDHTELIAGYEKAVEGAEVIIIDNGSSAESAKEIHGMAERLIGSYIRNASNVGFGEANNQGVKEATGEVILFLNNDIITTLPGFVRLVLHDVIEDGVLYGPELRQWDVDGEPVQYINGHCLAMTRATWEKLGGWDTERYKRAYFEDTALSWKAQQLGMKLKRTNWPLVHLGNQTSAGMAEEAFKFFHHNQRAFFEQVREARKAIAESVA